MRPLQKLQKCCPKRVGAFLYIPKGEYYIAAYKIAGGVKRNKIDDIIFKNCNNLIINGNNNTDKRYFFKK